MAIRIPEHSEQRLDAVPDVVAAGQQAKGDHVCADCGYGVAAVRPLPACPMCRGTSWLPQPGRGPMFPRST
jgi:rubrerythrin